MNRQTSNPEFASPRGVVAAGGLADWAELLRPRVAVFVVMAAFVGGLLAAGPTADIAAVMAAAILVGMTAGAASIFNQVLERDTDALMERTANRPLVTGRIAPRDAILFGAALGTVGVAGLAISFNVLAALLALSTLASYTLVYTPLKRVSTFNTVVGAIPGAMPPLLGFVALAGGGGPWGFLLFAILFAWQFPHFMAIAWMYREDYARAELRMLPALAGAEGLAGRQAIAYGLVLFVISLLPYLQRVAGPIYLFAAVLLGAMYVGASIAFGLRETRGRARAVLFTSLLYLPLLFSFVLLDPVVRLSVSQ